MISFEYEGVHLDVDQATEENVMEALHAVGIPEQEPGWFEHLSPSNMPLEDIILNGRGEGGYQVIPITDTTDLTVHYSRG